MSRQPLVHALLRQLFLVTVIAGVGAPAVRAQEASPPAYLAAVTGDATLERDGEAEPARPNMPFVTGDRLRTGAGRVEIAFPDGSGIEIGEYSEVEAVSSTRVRLIAGTMDYIRRPMSSSQSASYLPSDLRVYGSTLDQYGSWQYASPYGYVWYPAVGPDWRPYYYGSWSPIRSYGWTWIGVDPWAWPTHHYGRWGYARNTWFWIPGRSWAAAWVSWSFADDYVSWCPLGYDSRPVFALSVGYRRGWDDWTVARRGFGARGAYVGRYEQSSVPSRHSSVASPQAPLGARRPIDDGRVNVGLGRPRAGDYRSTIGVARPRTGDAPPEVNASRLRTDDGRPRTDGLRTDDGRLRTVVPPTNAGAFAAPRAVERGSIVDSRRFPTTDYRQPRVDYGRLPSGVDRQPNGGDRQPSGGDRQPMPEYRRPPAAEYRQPTTDYRSSPREGRPGPPAPAAPVAGAAAPRPMPHERAAPSSGGDARPRAQERPADGRRPR